MKKGLTFIALLLVLLLTACNPGDELSGKTFHVAYTPVMQEDIGHPEKYDTVMSLKFSKGNKVTNIMDDTKGNYERTDDLLVVHFEDENEKLDIHFQDFQESEKDFSMYSTVIRKSQIQLEDTSQVSQFKVLNDKLIKNHPIEFMEE